MKARARARARSRRRNDAADLVVEHLSVLERMENADFLQKQPLYPQCDDNCPLISSIRLLSIDFRSTGQDFVIASASSIFIEPS